MDSGDQQDAQEQLPLNCLMDWMRFISGEERHYYDHDMSVQIFGEDDMSYAVFERKVSISPAAVDQYVVLASGTGNALFSLLCFLSECGFRLSNVMERLANADYLGGYKSRFSHVTVTYGRVTEAKS